MKSNTYDAANILDRLDFRRLMAPIDRAGRLWTRVDERLTRSPNLAPGFRIRSDLLEACASLYLDGELVHLEDLVLHDAKADVRAPTHELTRAARLLRLRRRLGRLCDNGVRHNEDDVFSRAGIERLVRLDRDGTPSTPAERRQPERAGKEEGDEVTEVGSANADDPYAALLDEIDAVSKRAEDLLSRNGTQKSDARENRDRAGEGGGAERDSLDDWLNVLEVSRDLPSILAAALLLDAWLWLDPYSNHADLGRQLAAAYLRRTMLNDCLPTLSVGLRGTPFRWRAADPPKTRISCLVSGFGAGAEAAIDQVHRLSLARERMMQHCQSSNRNARLPDLIDLFLTYPYVSRPMAAKVLNVTPRGIDTMLEKLGPARPRELTGRSRYRAWGVL